MKYLKPIIGIILLLALLLFVDWKETGAIIRESDRTLLAIALVLLLVNMPLSSVKWELLLRYQDVRAGFFPALRAYWIGSFFSNYLPSSVGGDVVRLFVLRAEGKKAEVASSILVDALQGCLLC